MKAQIIEKDGRPEFAVIPYEDYRHFLELLEDEADARVVAEFHEAYTAGREFIVPDEIVRRELAGESSIKLWREHRGLTQQELATRAGKAMAVKGVSPRHGTYFQSLLPLEQLIQHLSEYP